MSFVNRGTGASGSNTNKKGKALERQLSLCNLLKYNKFNKFKYGLIYKDDDLKILYFEQGNFKKYLHSKYNINKKDFGKLPDMAIIIEKNNEIYVKILEVKNQNVSGTTDEKLMGAPVIRKAYEHKFKKYNLCWHVDIIYILNDWFMKHLTKKNLNPGAWNKILNILADDYNVYFLNGQSDDYHKKIINWVLTGNVDISHYYVDDSMDEDVLKSLEQLSLDSSD